MDMKPPTKELFASFGFEPSCLNKKNASWNSDDSVSDVGPLPKSIYGIWTNDDSAISSGSSGGTGNQGHGSSSQHSERTYSQSSNMSWNSDLSPTANWVYGHGNNGNGKGLNDRSSPKSTTTTLVGPGSPDGVFPRPPTQARSSGTPDGIFPFGPPESYDHEGVFPLTSLSTDRDKDRLLSLSSLRSSDGIFPITPDSLYPLAQSNFDGVFPISSGSSDGLLGLNAGSSDGVFPINSDELGLSSWSVSRTPDSLEVAAKKHREHASQIQPSHVWHGELPPRSYSNATFSCKVFLGGLPFDMTEYGMIQAFRPFGPVRIEWPGKDSQPLSQARGFAYVIFENEKQVKTMLSHCVRRGDLDAKWFCKLSSRQVKMKVVEVIPWAINDSNFSRCPASKLDASLTIFVGALHGMLNAEGLCTVMQELFGGVVHAGIDTDKHKYPIGSGRVSFDNYRSYFQAVNAAYIVIESTKFTKTIQVDPYVEDAICSECTLQQAPYFCRNLSCFRYFCHSCFEKVHFTAELKNHQPVMRNPNKRSQTKGTNDHGNWNNNGYNNNGGGRYYDGNQRPNRGRGFGQQGHSNNYNHSHGRNNRNNRQNNYGYGQANNVVSNNPAWPATTGQNYNNGYGSTYIPNSGSNYNSNSGPTYNPNAAPYNPNSTTNFTPGSALPSYTSNNGNGNAFNSANYDPFQSARQGYGNNSNALYGRTNNTNFSNNWNVDAQEWQ